jgi:hypothetical protein
MSDHQSNSPDKKSGGLRVGAGRKAGTGKFGESTEVLRIPSSQKAVISDFLAAYQRKHALDGLDPVSEITLPTIAAKSFYLPLFGSKVPATSVPAINRLLNMYHASRPSPLPAYKRPASICGAA